jgi:hypothetical protein
MRTSSLFCIATPLLAPRRTPYYPLRAGSGTRAPTRDPEQPGMSGDQPLVPELEECRAAYRWAAAEASRLLEGVDDERFNARPAKGKWSAAECLSHLLVSGEALLPFLDAAIRGGREKEILGRGPFRYGRLGEWFVRQSGGGGSPPVRRIPAPRLYAPTPRRHPVGPTLREFHDLQEALSDRLQLSSGLHLARVRVRSPVTPLLQLGLGQWFRLVAGHQRRHLGQARRALEAAGKRGGSG